jgi:uncharacterized protein YcbK (DUF882 family)
MWKGSESQHVPVSLARMVSLCSRPVRAGYSASLAALLILIGSNSLENAVAEGDTRTISFHHIHTDEDLTVTYKVNGRYDPEALKQINHELRDWRKNETIEIDPHLIDLVWEVHRELESNQPIWVVCGYRSPATNAMLRQRSSGVAKFSQHMLGKAMDFYIPGVPLEKLRETGLRAQRGGVGFYPSSNFVHLDTGSVRHWPRMPEAQLAAVIAKGPLSTHRGDRTPSGNRDSKVASASRISDPIAKLLAQGKDEDEDQQSKAAATKPSRAPVAKASHTSSAEIKTAAVMPKPSPRPTTPKFAANDEAAPHGFSLASAASRSVDAKLGLRQASASPSALDIGTPDVQLPQLQPASGAAENAASDPPRPAADVPVAGADPGATANASIAPWPTPLREPDGALLSYAPINSVPLPSRLDPMGTGAMREPPQPATTIATKHIGHRPTILMSPLPSPSTFGSAKPGQRFSDPWMRAMIVSPSADAFMSTSQLGRPDYRALSPYLRKPSISVMMTFSEDPYLGMSTAKFDGSAVVFVSTVTFYRRTASLQ